MAAVSAVENPEAAVALSDEVLAKAHGDDGRVDDAPPTAPALVDTTVALPGGLVDLPHMTVHRTAEVRELDGDDEEALARAGANFSKLLDTVLTRGVVSVGTKESDRTVLDQLLAADRDALLLAIRRVTFGDDIEWVDVRCPSCQAVQEVTVSITRDIPTKTLDDPMSEVTFDLSLKSGKQVTVRLPDGSVQRAMAAVENPTEASLNTVMLAKCVESINGIPVVSDDQVRKGLKIQERREILKEINDRNPGPRLGEVKRPCSSCSEDIPMPVSLVALFLV